MRISLFELPRKYRDMMFTLFYFGAIVIALISLIRKIISYKDCTQKVKATIIDKRVCRIRNSKQIFYKIGYDYDSNHYELSVQHLHVFFQKNVGDEFIMKINPNNPKETTCEKKYEYTWRLLIIFLFGFLLIWEGIMKWRGLI